MIYVLWAINTETIAPCHPNHLLQVPLFRDSVLFDVQAKLSPCLLLLVKSEYWQLMLWCKWSVRLNLPRCRKFIDCVTSSDISERTSSAYKLNIRSNSSWTIRKSALTTLSRLESLDHYRVSTLTFQEASSMKLCNVLIEVSPFAFTVKWFLDELILYERSTFHRLSHLVY